MLGKQVSLSLFLEDILFDFSFPFFIQHESNSHDPANLFGVENSFNYSSLNTRILCAWYTDAENIVYEGEKRDVGERFILLP